MQISFDQLTKSKPGLILVSIIGFFVVSSIALAVTLAFALEGKFDNHEDFSIYDTPLVGPTIAEKYEFLEKLPKSKLGIYPKGGAAVATDTKPCAHMGTDIFRKNGTVVDAAIAVLVCNGAVHSHSLGFGGGFFMTLFINGSSYFLNAREKAPSGATKTMFVENSKGSTEGPLAIAIPAELKGYVEAKERFGNPDISLLELFQPTIDLCENGFKVTRSLERAINQFDSKTKFDQNLREEFTNPSTGDFFKEGDEIKRKKFAKTLTEIGESGSADILYTGSMGEKIVKEIQELGGIITMEDLNNFEVSWEETLSFKLKGGLNLHTPPPPGSGAIVGGILKILDHFEPYSSAKENEIIYKFLEASKFAFAQRSKLGDWENDLDVNEAVNKTVQYILGDEWLNWVTEIWNDKATTLNTTFYGADFQYVPPDHGTSHVSILAPNGDAVSVTSTVNTYFGSGIMSPSTRIIFNNQMDDFSTPNVTNNYGIPPSEHNFIVPGKRPTSSMAPSIIVDNNNKVKLVLGASGGPRIISAVAYVALKHLYLKENVKSAIDCPRPHHQLVPMKVDYEIGVLKETVDYLESKHHKVDVVDPYFAKTYGGARVQAISVDENHIITANNDRRKEGEVDGF